MSACADCGHPKSVHEWGLNCLDPSCACTRYTMRKPQYVTATLAGDGRVRLTHRRRLDTLWHSQPEEVKRAVARRLIEMFQETGRSTHSGRGALLWVIVEWCALNEVACRVIMDWDRERDRPAGYMVERLPASPAHCYPARTTGNT